MRSWCAFGALLLVLLLAACGSGEAPGAAAAATSPSTTSAATTAPPSSTKEDPLAAACAQHCAVLLAAQSKHCPEPTTNVSLCVPYLTELSQAVYDVRDALEQTPAVSQVHGDLQAAVDSNIQAVEKFAADRCFAVTSASVNNNFACGMEPLSIIISAATVGILLDAAAK